MSTATGTEVKKRFAALRVLLYLLILAGILTVWFVGLRWLLTHEFVGNIYAGLQTTSQGWAVPVSTWRLLVGIGLLLGLIIFRKRTMALVPVELRTLILPLPFYLLFTNDWRWAGVLAAVAVVLWVFHKRLAPHMNRVPPLLFPLVYVYLFTRSILQTVGIALLLAALLLFNVGMREFFEPVWRFQSHLPKRLLQVLLGVRLLVGLSIPLVLSYSLGMVPIGYPHPFPLLSLAFSDNTLLLFIVSVFAGLFVIRAPALERQA